MFLQSTFLLYRNIYKKFNNDSVDRLHQIFTPNLLITFALLFLLRLLATPSIHCFENAYELSMWNWFINYYCYVEDLYFISPKQIHFPVDSTRNAARLHFYPWIPVVLVAQAFLCMIPHYFWEAFSFKTGILIRQTAAALALSDKRAKKMLKKKGTIRNNSEAAKGLLQTLRYNSLRIDRVYGILPPRYYLSICYILYKLANLANIICQLFFLNRFFNTQYTFWGAEILWDLWHHVSWETSGHFPRVVYCDFPRRDDVTGKTFFSTSMCLIAFNLFNEVMFIGIWFLFTFLIIVNVISILKLFILLFWKRSYAGFIEDLLKHHGIDRSNPEFNYFIEEVLGKDGLVTLRLLSSNSLPFSISEFLNELFTHYKDYFPEAVKDDIDAEIA